MTLVEEIKKRKTVSFSEYQELALYDPSSGFYETGGGAGRDFITSVEVGAVFAEVIAAALDTWWGELGKPNPFFFVEVGAGRGTFATNLLGAEPACLGALKYITVERSLAMRETQEDTHHGAFEVRAELPKDLHREAGVVFANELLDNMPVDIYDDADELCVKVKAKAPLWTREVVGRPFPEQTTACKWLRDALGVFGEGRVVAIDYMRTTAEMRELPMEHWLRAYKGQAKAHSVFDNPGEFDITCDVAIDQLRWVRTPIKEATQAEFLKMHGIEGLREKAENDWRSGASVGDLAALKAKSRISEVAALTEAGGLGGFTVCEWAI